VSLVLGVSGASRWCSLDPEQRGGGGECAGWAGEGEGWMSSCSGSVAEG